MEENKSEQVASQTEIPVDQAPPIIEKKKSHQLIFSTLLDKIKDVPLWAAGIVAVLVLVIIGVTIFIMGGSKTEDDSDLQKASGAIEQAYLEGNLDDAERLVDDAIVKYGEEPGLIESKIEIISSRGNLTGNEKESLAESKKYIDKILEEDGENPSVLITAGYAYETAGEYESALEFYDKALSRDPNSSMAWFHKGHALQFLGRQDEANKAYDEAYKLDPNNPLVLIVYGNRHALSDPEKSFGYFMQASEAQSATKAVRAEALTGAAIVKQMQILTMGDSLAISQKAVDENPEFAPALAVHGMNLFLNGDPAGAVENLEKATIINPRISRNYYQLAVVLRSDGQYDNAIDLLNEAINRLSDDNTLLEESIKNDTRAEYVYELARTYSMSGGDDDTVILLTQATLLKPSLKTRLKEDFEQYGFFQEMGGNQQFLNLINT